MYIRFTLGGGDDFNHFGPEFAALGNCFRQFFPRRRSGKIVIGTDDDGAVFQRSFPQPFAHRRGCFHLQVDIGRSGFHRLGEPPFRNVVSADLLLPAAFFRIGNPIGTLQVGQNLRDAAGGHERHIGRSEQSFDIIRRQRAAVEADFRHLRGFQRLEKGVQVLML